MEWTRAARVDRVEIYRHIEADNPRAAADLDRRFDSTVGRLADFPHLGRLGRVPNTRELVAHRNYVIIYEIDGAVARILRLLHVARQWP